MAAKKLFYVFLITVVQLSGVYLAFGAWLEEYEAVFQSFFAGIYTLPPVEMVWVDIYGGIIPLLSKLAYLFYPWPVNHYLLFATLAGCCLLINYCAFGILESAHASRPAFLITFLIFGILLYPQFTVLLQCTRASVLICIAAFFAAALSFTQGREDVRHLLPMILLLAAATVVRIFTAAISSGLLLMLGVLMWRKQFLLSRTGRILAVFFLLQSWLIAALMLYRSHSRHPGDRYVMTYEYAVTNRDDLYPHPANASRQDSIRFQLLKNWLVTDTFALSESFVRSHIRHITISDILSDKRYLAEQLPKAVTRLMGFARLYFYQIAALAGLILLLPFKQKMLGTGWMAAVAALLVMLTVIGSMYDRGFAPFTCLTLSGLWLLWAQHPNRYGKNALYLFLLLILAASFFSATHLTAIRKENIRWRDAHSRFNETILRLDSLQPVMMQSADMVMFPGEAFTKFPPRDDGKILMLHAGYLSFFDFFNRPYREKFNVDITNGQSIANFISMRHDKGVVFLTTSGNIGLFKDYLQAFFGLVIDAEKSDVPPIESPQHTLHFFMIRDAGQASRAPRQLPEGNRNGVPL